MKALSEKEFSSKFGANTSLTEQAEKAKQSLFPIMQEIQKYIPDVEYGYYVLGSEYPEFYSVRIEFTRSGIRFHMHKIYKENKYKIDVDMEHFKNIGRDDIERIAKQYEKPCNIGVFTTKKVNDWIDYCTTIYNQAAKEDTERTQKVTNFLKSIEDEAINWQNADHTKGHITRNGLRFTFSVEEGYIYTSLELSYHGMNDYNKFKSMADNQFFPNGNY